jgi:hypothetical protein
MLRQIDALKILTCLAVISLASAGVAFAQGNNTPANPNCTQGVRGCENYVTTDHSDASPTKNAAQMAPNCTQGQKDCTNYPTTDHSDDNPNKQTTK